MKQRKNTKRMLSLMAFGFLMVTGTYNAIVINSESSLKGSDVRFVKRLDEVYGVVESGRVVAASLQWQKLSVKQAAILKEQSKLAQTIVPDVQIAQEAPVVTQAAVQDDLSLTLTEVINPKKWQQGLSASQFNGSLSTNNGVIETLNVSLPNGEGLSVSFSEMTGNVFEYDFGGELYSGMMYQVDQHAYMVTLTNGPLEGTRLKFTAEASVEDQMQAEESQRSLAENQEAEAGMNKEEPANEEQAQQTVEYNPGYQQEALDQPMDNYQAADAFAQQQALEQAGEQQTYQVEPQTAEYQGI
jgi:hypothetical protein